MTIFDLEHLESLSQNTNVWGGAVMAAAAGNRTLAESINGSVLGITGAAFGVMAVGLRNAWGQNTNENYVVVTDNSAASGSSSSSSSGAS